MYTVKKLLETQNTRVYKIYIKLYTSKLHVYIKMRSMKKL